MTSKRNRFYQIWFIASSLVIIGLLAFMGITAIQKSLTLNLSFQSNPVIVCELKIGEEVIFDNGETPKIGGGVENITGNILTFNQEKLACTMGLESFNLTITNNADTNSAILIEFDNATIGGNSSFTDIIACEGSETYSITPTSLVQITMTKVVEVGITLSTGVSIDTENSNLLTTSTSKYYLEHGTDLEADIIIEDGYQTPTYTLNGGTAVDITNNTITIAYNNLVNENGEAGLKINVEVPPVSVNINFTFSGDKSNIGSDFYFIIVITNDDGFDITTCPSDAAGFPTDYCIWKSSYDSKYYCHYTSLTDHNGVSYEQATLTTGITNNYKGYTYTEAVTKYNVTTLQEFPFNNVAVGDKVYIYLSYLRSWKAMFHFGDIASNVAYNSQNGGGTGRLAGINFEVPTKNVEITIDGVYSYVD